MRISHGILICELKGNFVSSPEVNQMRDALWKTCADGNVDLILDFDAVDRFDSSGLGLLTLILGKLSSVGRQFAISRPSEVLRKTLNVTKLDTLIPVHSSIGDAEHGIRGGEHSPAGSPPKGSESQAEQRQSPAATDTPQSP